MNKHEVQIIANDLIKTERVKQGYSNLYNEVFAQDKISNSSWYGLSDQAFEEWNKYNN